MHKICSICKKLGCPTGWWAFVYLSHQQSCESIFLGHQENLTGKRLPHRTTTKADVSSDVFMRLDYCNSLFYGLQNELIQRMQKVQNCAARLVSKKKLSSRSLNAFIFDNHWLQVKFRPIYKILLIVHNCLHNDAPNDIKSMIQYGDSPRTLLLHEPAFNNKFGKRSFSRSGPKLWNSLPSTYAWTLRLRN